MPCASTESGEAIATKAKAISALIFVDETLWSAWVAVAKHFDVGWVMVLTWVILLVGL